MPWNCFYYASIQFTVCDCRNSVVKHLPSKPAGAGSSPTVLAGNYFAKKYVDVVQPTNMVIFTSANRHSHNNRFGTSGDVGSDQQRRNQKKLAQVNRATAKVSTLSSRE